MQKHIIAFTERVSATFLFAFLGVVVASGASDTTALKAAGIAGGLSVAKYLYTATGSYLSTPDAPAQDTPGIVGSTTTPDPTA